MRVYTVHERAWAAGEDRDAVLVREGFSWMAALFSPLWAISNGMWRASLGLFALEIALDALFAVSEAEDPAAILLFVAARVWIGFAGNDWRRASLARGGYVMTAIVAAPDRDRAEQRFLDRHA